MGLSRVGLRMRLVASIAVMLAAIGVVMYFNLEDQRRRMTEDAQAGLFDDARLVAAAHDQVLASVGGLLDSLVADPQLRDFNSPGCNDAAARVIRANPAYSNVAVSGLDGVVHCSATPGGVNSQVGDRPYYQDAVAKKSVTTSGYLFGRISKRPVDVFAQPILAPGGAVLGVVEASVDITWIENVVRGQKLESDVQTTVIGPDGLVLFRVPADNLKPGATVAGQAWADLVLGQTEPRTGEVQEPDKPLALSAAIPLAKVSGVAPGHVLVTIPKSVALAAADATFRRNLVALGVVGVLSLAWAWVMSTFSVHKPIAALVSTTREYAAGRLDTRAEVTALSSSEVRDLSSAFSTMAETIHANQAEMRRHATTDDLTGLPNRREFARLLDAELRSGGGELEVLMVVLHDFSAVYATFGFERGDELILQVARRVADILDDDGLIGRTGGDEFAIAVPAHTVDAIGALEAVFALPFTLDDEPVHLTARVGRSVSPGDGTYSMTLVRRAVLALRRAKQGPRAFASYDAVLDEPRAEHLRTLAALRSALERNELDVYYQPKVELATGTIMGAEALIRWRRADGSFVPPSEFIPLAEQSGLISDITMWVIETAARQARVWLDAGVVLEIGVNVSAADFEDARIATMLRGLLGRLGLGAHAIDLEITETSLMADPDAAAATCEEMRTLGYSIAIDDFGAGYSPLIYLHRLPISMIKIDQSFTRDLMTNQRSRDIVANTVSLTQRFGIGSVAEGVETAEVALALQELGCTIGQGYYFARPLPAEEFGEWLVGNPLGLRARQLS